MVLSRDEIKTILNDFYLVYPSMFKDIEDPRRKDRYISLYEKYIGCFTYEDVTRGLEKYIQSEQGKYSPSIHDIIGFSKVEQKQRLRKEGNSDARIETPEEVMYQIYLNEMKKEPGKRNEDLIRRCLPAAKLFNEPEAYKRHFGKTREEYERL
jgi:hypothetical protein